MKNTNSQAVESHARYLVDGHFIENLGRNSASFQVRAPLINGLTPAANEEWNGDDLFPGTFQSLYQAYASGKTDTFVHPIQGEITCKLIAFDYDLEPNVRNGVMVDMTFQETLVDDESTSALSTEVFATAGQAAFAIKRTLDALPDSDATQSFGLDDILNAITVFIDSFAILGLEANMFLDSMVGKFQRLMDHAEFLGIQAEDLGDFLIACNVCIDACLKVAAPKRATGYKRLPSDMTLPQAAAYVGNDPSDFLSLNPSLASFFIVDSGTLVNFYL